MAEDLGFIGGPTSGLAKDRGMHRIWTNRTIRTLARRATCSRMGVGWMLPHLRGGARPWRGSSCSVHCYLVIHDQDPLHFYGICRPVHKHLRFGGDKMQVVVHVHTG